MTEDTSEKEETPAPAAAETGGDTAPQSDQGQQAAASGAPQTMGKMVIPDLSPMTDGQSENVQAMTAVTKEASQTLEKIVTAQRAVLESTLKNLQISIQESSGTAAIPSGKVPDLNVQVQNLKLSIDKFCLSAETLSSSTEKSFVTLSQSVEKSLAKIEEVANKFSGG
ncbi:MAG: hypothetical protein JKX94_04335 [Sneathiella sp.]|nr:hypothetical protein [Sneathiella sp.]